MTYGQSGPDKRGRGTYAPVHLFPQTIEQLRDRSGEYADAAVAEIQWGAVTTCSMQGMEFSNSWQVVNVAVMHCRAEDRMRLGWPDYLGRMHTPAFHDLSPEAQSEARLVGAETLADWRAADCPYLTSDSIKRTYCYIQSCIRIAAEAEQTNIKEKAE